MVEAHRIADPGSGEGVFPINKTLIQTQPVRQDPPFAYCILHISYSLYILHNLVSTSDDELEAPGTELLSLFGR